MVKIDQQAGDILSDAYDVQRQVALDTVRILDPELLKHSDTQQLVKLGVDLMIEVTNNYGTPTYPKWASGEHETNVFMTYHNGGRDGHTSVESDGVGVPRNVLVLAAAINEAADREVYSPIIRAAGFGTGSGHDERLLNGRALMPEGRAKGRGDERQSAKDVFYRCLKSGSDLEIAQLAFWGVMATAFNPKTNTQNVSYEAWRQNPNDPKLTKTVLFQELLAAADLLSCTGPYGPLNSIEYSIESLCLIDPYDQLLQKRLEAQGIDAGSIDSTQQLLEVIGKDKELREAFVEAVAGKSKFTADLRYSDEAIRLACGQGIDELFPGRQQNVVVLDKYAAALRLNTEPLAIWQDARAYARARS